MKRVWCDLKSFHRVPCGRRGGITPLGGLQRVSRHPLLQMGKDDTAHGLKEEEGATKSRQVITLKGRCRSTHGLRDDASHLMSRDLEHSSENKEAGSPSPRRFLPGCQTLRVWHDHGYIYNALMW